jgi:ABC-type multidrug transport system fused ATPase/permease subunit
MIDSFRKLRDLLDQRERRNAMRLLALMLVMGLVEVLGVASIMPFMAVLSNPDLIQTNPYLSAVYEGLDFDDRSKFLIFLAAVAFIVVVGRIAGTALTSYATARYGEMRSSTLSTRLLENYMRRPYSWFLNHHSADMGKRVLTEVDWVIKGSLIPALRLISQGATAVFLIALVLFVQPLVALTVLLVLGGAYFIIYLNLRRYLSKIGGERFTANFRRHLTVNEAMAGIKELKAGGLERAYLRRFSQAAHHFGRLKSLHVVANEMPRHVLEALAIGAILSVVIVLLVVQGRDISRMFPVLALYAFVGLRLLPAIQQVYASVVSLRFNSPALNALHADLKDANNAPIVGFAGVSSKPLRLRRLLELRNVTFTYPNAERPSLYKLSISIPARSTIGFVGSTGAGKTTVVDVILGLLEPQTGDVIVDNVRITSENSHNWRHTIGYVPQHIFIADETVAANVALGAPPDKIDMKAVEQSARMAGLHDFVIRELPQAYNTKVGEQGIRLSGGQRQRIGIARALYHDPDVLILDEATSALDNVTERVIIDAVHNLSHRKTILIIAHRLTTVRACDQLFLLKDGRLRAQGTYDDLLNADEGFRQMAS